MLLWIILSVAAAAAFLMGGILIELQYRRYEIQIRRRLTSARPEESERKPARRGALSAMLPLVGGALGSLNLQAVKDYRKKMEALLSEAHSRLWPDFEYFLGYQFLLGIVSILLLSQILGGSPLIFLLYFAGGALLPQMLLKGEIARRKDGVVRALPDATDLMAMCMGAGLDFSAALRKYLERGEPSPLREELIVVQEEVALGKSREDALEGFGEKVRHPAVASFVSAVTQGLRTGSGMVPILKSQAEQLRVLRTQRAEKAAAEAPVKMLFPLLVFIFPTTFVILFGPIVLQLMSGGF